MGGWSEKQLEICKPRKIIQREWFCLSTCKVSRNHDDPDVGMCTGVDLGKKSEKEPVLCHCVDQPRPGKHGVQEAGKENRGVRTCRSRRDQGICSLVYMG